MPNERVPTSPDDPEFVAFTVKILHEAVAEALEKKRRLGHYAVIASIDDEVTYLVPDENGVFQEMKELPEKYITKLAEIRAENERQRLAALAMRRAK